MKINSPILICVAAVAVNLLGSFVAKNFNLPLYLDTGGTIFIAMMSGYVPAVIVGFATNFFNSFVEESEMFYCSISIFVAIFVTFLARRGKFRRFSTTLLTIPALALITTFLTLIIEKFLYCTGVMQVLSELENFPTVFMRELADKGLLILIMFVAIKFVPQSVKNFFSGLGQKQAPLTDDMKHEVYRRKCPISSLRTKVLLILMLSSLFIAASIASISYKIFEQACVGVQIKIADGVAKIAASEINPSRVDDFIKRGRNAADFEVVEHELYAIKDSNPDIRTICIFSGDGEPFMQTDVPSVALENFAYKNNISTPIFSDNLLTICKPVLDGGGNCVCYVAVDISMDLISHYGKSFVAKVLALFSGCFVFVFVIGLRFVENNIILPVNTMAFCAENFVYDSGDHCADNVEQIKRLKIHTGDEIENLYDALLRTTQDVQNYFEKLRRANKKVAEMDELAHKDSLTGIKNKAAYDEATAVLDKKISAGDAQFSIVMVDVNYLKRINDTYGHERGNSYLLNASRLICAVFGEDNVYRIGGDEFVVILDGERVSLSKYFITQFKAEMDRKNSNARLQPWEKVSAAVGASRYEAGVDKNSEEVFKRADAQMYENKLAMKAARTD